MSADQSANIAKIKAQIEAKKQAVAHKKALDDQARATDADYRTERTKREQAQAAADKQALEDQARATDPAYKEYAEARPTTAEIKAADIELQKRMSAVNDIEHLAEVIDNVLNGVDTRNRSPWAVRRAEFIDTVTSLLKGISWMMLVKMLLTLVVAGAVTALTGGGALISVLVFLGVGIGTGSALNAMFRPRSNALQTKTEFLEAGRKGLKAELIEVKKTFQLFAKHQLEFERAQTDPEVKAVAGKRAQILEEEIEMMLVQFCAEIGLVPKDENGKFDYSKLYAAINRCKDENAADVLLTLLPAGNAARGTAAGVNMPLNSALSGTIGQYAASAVAGATSGVIAAGFLITAYFDYQLQHQLYKNEQAQTTMNRFTQFLQRVNTLVKVNTTLLAAEKERQVNKLTAISYDPELESFYSPQATSGAYNIVLSPNTIDATQSISAQQAQIQRRVQDTAILGYNTERQLIALYGNTSGELAGQIMDSYLEPLPQSTLRIPDRNNPDLDAYDLDPNPDDDKDLAAQINMYTYLTTILQLNDHQARVVLHDFEQVDKDFLAQRQATPLSESLVNAATQQNMPEHRADIAADRDTAKTAGVPRPARLLLIQLANKLLSYEQQAYQSINKVAAQSVANMQIGPEHAKATAANLAKTSGLRAERVSIAAHETQTKQGIASNPETVSITINNPPNTKTRLYDDAIHSAMKPSDIFPAAPRKSEPTGTPTKPTPTDEHNIKKTS